MYVDNALIVDFHDLHNPSLSLVDLLRVMLGAFDRFRLDNVDRFCEIRHERCSVP